MNSKLNNLLSVFQIKEAEKNIFEIILDSGFINATDLARQGGITRTSVYDYLERLLEKGLIVETLKDGVKFFSVEQPGKIELLLKDRESIFLEAKRSLNELKSEYGKRQSVLRPRLQMYEGRPALEQMMKDLLLYDNITMRVYWPILDVIKLLGAEFVEEFNRKRLKQKIVLKTIWPQNQVPSFKQYPFLKIGSENKREVRLAPKGVDFSLGYSIYENTVRFISSSKENFGFLIASREFAHTMRSNFDAIWDISEQLLI